MQYVYLIHYTMNSLVHAVFLIYEPPREKTNVLHKPMFCICENKDAQLISAFGFATYVYVPLRLNPLGGPPVRRVFRYTKC